MFRYFVVAAVFAVSVAQVTNTNCDDVTCQGTGGRQACLPEDVLYRCYCVGNAAVYAQGSSVEDCPEDVDMGNSTDSSSSSSSGSDDDDDSKLPMVLGIVGGVIAAAILVYFAFKGCKADSPEQDNLLEDPAVNATGHVEKPIRPEELRRSVYDPEHETNKIQQQDVLAE